MAECRFRIIYNEGNCYEATMVCVEHEVNPALCSVGQAELEAQLAAAEEALDFAVGALQDAIYTEDGLDGETGERVLCLLAEWKRDHTFDKKRVSREEMFAIHSLPYDQVYVQRLETVQKTLRDTVKKLETVARRAEALSQTLSHEVNCQFSGCTCGSAAKQADALLEFNRALREVLAEAEETE